MKILAAILLSAGMGSAFAQPAQVPPPGASPRIDAIKKAGVLRVGVLSNPPWLIENTSGSGEAWDGPAWTLAKEYARQLNVTLQPIPVSHETKVPVVANARARKSHRLHHLCPYESMHVRPRRQPEGRRGKVVR